MLSRCFLLLPRLFARVHLPKSQLRPFAPSAPRVFAPLLRTSPLDPGGVLRQEHTPMASPELCDGSQTAGGHMVHLQLHRHCLPAHHALPVFCPVQSFGSAYRSNPNKRTTSYDHRSHQVNFRTGISHQTILKLAFK